MHEFSIVQSIVDIVLASAASHNIKHVSSVEVEVGQASGVIKEAMEFAWKAAGKGTILNNTILKIRQIPLKMRCRNCQTEYQPGEIYEPCPGCGEIGPEILTGKELRVVAIET